MLEDEFVDSQAVVGRLRERMFWRHAIIHRKDRDAQCIGPYSRVILHGSAGKGHESSAVEVEDGLLNDRKALIRSTAANCFLLWVLPYVLVGKQPDRDGVGPFLEDVHIGVEDSISRHEHLDIVFDALVSEL